MSQSIKILRKGCLVAALGLFLCVFSCNKKIEEKKNEPHLDVYVKMENGKTLLILEPYEKYGNGVKFQGADMEYPEDVESNVLKPSEFLWVRTGRKWRGYYVYDTGKPLSSIPDIDKNGAKFSIFAYSIDNTRCVSNINLRDIRKRD